MKSSKLQLKNINKRQLKNTVFSSSKIEGVDFLRAKKNFLLIKKLQTHGRAFSI